MRWQRARRAVVSVTCGTVAAAAATASAGTIALRPIVTGLSSPVALAAPPDESGRLFIVEQAGTIRILAGETLLPDPFLDLTAQVSAGGERGLLGLAFHPGYAANGRFFVFYTNPGGDLVLAEHAVSADPDRAGSDGSVLLTIPHPAYGNHNGGQIAFGPDGYLYAGTGDGGGGGDPADNAQNPAVLLGKILRLDVDGSSLIPADNPFADGDASTRDEIWAWGLRNPWRFSFDRATGDLFIGDVGQGCQEEIDFTPPAPEGGNFGWNVMEGSRCYDPSSCSPPPACGVASFRAPILTVSHDDPAECAVIGGYRYRGTAIPALAGAYVFADYCSGRVRISRASGGVWTVEAAPLESERNITTFGEDESGELWVADASGTVSRLVAGLAWSDDFEDGEASDWTPRSGDWSIAAGRLAAVAERRAEIISPAPYCATCSVEATVRIDAPGSEASLVGWRRGAGEFVELRLSEPDDRLTLRQVGRAGARERSIPWPVDVGTEAHLQIVFDGRELQAFVDGSGPLLQIRSGSQRAGGVAFRLKGRNGAAAFDDVAVH